MIQVNNGFDCNRIASQRDADEAEQLPSCIEEHWSTEKPKTVAIF